MNTPQVFYHFTAARFCPSIFAEGLTLGQVPLFVDETTVRLVPRLQWITTNPDWDQSWERGGTLGYRRNEVRFTIRLPRQQRKLCGKWLGSPFSSHWAMQSMAPPGTGADPQNWWLYRGFLHPSFLGNSVDFNPTYEQSENSSNQPG